jgi:hypothetical protein
MTSLNIHTTVSVEIPVSIEQVAYWFARTNNEEQIQFLNEVAMQMAEPGNFAMTNQLFYIVHPDPKAKSTLTTQAKVMILTLADLMRGE